MSNQNPSSEAAQSADPNTSSPQHNVLPMTVRDIRVVVPEALRVSENNTYYPNADIVWRGDPIGDRKAQIAAIMQEGFRKGTAPLNGATAVDIDIEIVRWHSVTEKARYTVGGVHNIIFKMTVRRAGSGEPLAPGWTVETNLPALGGTAAIEADRRGQTQKVRLIDHLSLVIQQQLQRVVTG